MQLTKLIMRLLSAQARHSADERPPLQILPEESVCRFACVFDLRPERRAHGMHALKILASFGCGFFARRRNGQTGWIANIPLDVPHASLYGTWGPDSWT